MSSPQTKIRSLQEACANVLIGYTVATLAQIVVFSAYGHNIPLYQNLQMGLIFTVISLVRSYAIRRFFNRHP